MPDEIQNIIMRVQNQERVERLTEAVRKEEAALAALDEQLRKGAITQADFDLRARPMATTLDRAEKGLKSAQAATRNYGQAALTASYAFQDFTSVQGSLVQKLGSVQNNIPGLLAGLGLGAGLAGVVSICSVAIGVLIPLITELIGTFAPEQVKAFSGSIDGLKKSLEYLEGKRYVLKVDYQAIRDAHKAIDEAQKALDAFERAKNQTTATQQEVGRRAQENVAENAGGTDAESGAANLQDFLKTRMAGTGELTAGAEGLKNQRDSKQAEIAAKKKQIAFIETLPGGEHAHGIESAQLKRLEADDAKLAEDLRKHGDEVVKKLIGRYTLGIDDARARIRDLVNVDPAAAQAAGIGDDFRASLEVDTAANVRQEKKAGVRQGQEKQVRDLDKARAAKVIDDGKEFGHFDEDLDKAIGEADGDKLVRPEERYKFVLDRVKAILQSHLAAKGIAGDDGQVKAAAEGIARQALDEDDKLKAQRAAGEQKRQGDAIDHQNAVDLAHQEAELDQRDAGQGQDASQGAGGVAGGPMRPAAPGLLGGGGGKAAGGRGQPLRPAGAAPLPPGMGGLGPGPAPGPGNPLAGLKGGALLVAKKKQRLALVKRQREAKDRARQFQIVRDNQKRRGATASGATAAPPRAPGAAPGIIQRAAAGQGRAVPPIPKAAAFNAGTVEQYFAQSQQVMGQQAAQITQLMGAFQQASGQLRMLGRTQQANMRRGSNNSYSNMPESM